MIRRAALALRVLLGAVFIYAAYTKLRQSWLLFALSIDSYQLLPEWAVFALARTLPALELALGVLLIAGVWLRYLSIVGDSHPRVVFFSDGRVVLPRSGNRLRVLRSRRAAERAKTLAARRRRFWRPRSLLVVFSARRRSATSAHESESPRSRL